jgi:hypothetical protein
MGRKRSLPVVGATLFVWSSLIQNGSTFCDVQSVTTRYNQWNIKQQQQQQRKRRRTLLVSTTTIVDNPTDDNDDDYFNWETGDVYGDLARLEQAIAFSQASDDLAHKERLDTLNYIAQQKHLIENDRLIKPLFLSFFLIALDKLSLRSRKILRALFALCNVHFTITILLAPLLLFYLKRQRDPPPEPMPEFLQQIEPKYHKYLTLTTDWIDPKVSTKDPILCLLEQQLSAVFLSACVCCWPGLSSPVLLLATRLGAAASLHQYPQVWYELVRTKHPLPWQAWALQTLNKLQLHAVMWIPALAQVFTTTSWVTILTAYMGILAVLAVVQWRPKWLKRDDKTLPLGLSIITGCLGAMVYLTPCRALPISCKIHPRQLLARVATLLALIGPITHLIAFQKLIRVFKSHNLPLTLSPSEFQKRLTELGAPDWRWQLNWRQPERVRVTLKNWINRFSYWLFLEGTVGEKLFQERKDDLRRDIRDHFEEFKKKILAEEFINRDQWKTNAMERVAAMHQKDYDEGNYQDPLGVAVHQTLGIGLGFSFDHMQRPGPGEEISTRQLQARAAKSAIRRVQELYDPEKIREAIEHIDDPVIQNQIANKMRKDADEEVQFLAKRLSDLIPTDRCLKKDESSKIEQFSLTYRRTGSHEYTSFDAVPDPLDALLGRSSTTNETDEFRNSWIDDSRSFSYADVPDDDSSTHDEFITEWEKRIPMMGGLGLDDEMDTALV